MDYHTRILDRDSTDRERNDSLATYGRHIEAPPQRDYRKLAENIAGYALILGVALYFGSGVWNGLERRDEILEQRDLPSKPVRERRYNLA